MPLSVACARCLRATHAHVPGRLRAGLAGLFEQPDRFEIENPLYFTLRWNLYPL